MVHVAALTLLRAFCRDRPPGDREVTPLLVLASLVSRGSGYLLGLRAAHVAFRYVCAIRSVAERGCVVQTVWSITMFDRRSLCWSSHDAA